MIMIVVFPHLYAHLEGENVESFKDVHQSPGEKGWAGPMAQLKQDEWLQ
jgi:hypothetical protein